MKFDKKRIKNKYADYFPYKVGRNTILVFRERINDRGPIAVLHNREVVNTAIFFEEWLVEKMYEEAENAFVPPIEDSLRASGGYSFLQYEVCSLMIAHYPSVRIVGVAVGDTIYLDKHRVYDFEDAIIGMNVSTSPAKVEKAKEA